MKLGAVKMLRKKNKPQVLGRVGEITTDGDQGRQRLQSPSTPLGCERSPTYTGACHGGLLSTPKTRIGGDFQKGKSTQRNIAAPAHLFLSLATGFSFS